MQMDKFISFIFHLLFRNSTWYTHIHFKIWGKMLYTYFCVFALIIPNFPNMENQLMPSFSKFVQPTWPLLRNLEDVEVQKWYSFSLVLLIFSSIFHKTWCILIQTFPIDLITIFRCLLLLNIFQEKTLAGNIMLAKDFHSAGQIFLFCMHTYC